MPRRIATAVIYGLSHLQMLWILFEIYKTSDVNIKFNVHVPTKNTMSQYGQGTGISITCPIYISSMHVHSLLLPGLDSKFRFNLETNRQWNSVII